jgi:3-hydroxyisobutyrate dehydrogenase
MKTVAFIGLGAMGSRMAMNLHQAGFRLHVHNRDRAKAKPFQDRGIAAFDSPAAAVKGASFVVSMVADDNATRDVMLGASGIVAAAAPGTVVLDCSTNTAAMAREVSKAAAARGVLYMDAPVSGSLSQAQGRELVFMAGGDKAAFEQAQPLFAAMGRMARHMGPVGAGATLKLINNTITATVQAVLAEAAVIAEAANLDRAACVEVLAEGAAGSRALKMKLPKMFSRDFAPQFSLELMDKDVRYFLQLAAELDRPAPVASLVRSQYQAARRADLGKLDSSAIFLYRAGEKPET